MAARRWVAVFLAVASVVVVPTVATASHTPPDSTDPPLPAGSGAGRRIVYSVAQQRVWLVDDVPTDHVDRTYLVSGRKGFPKPGTFQVYSTSRYSRSGSL